MKKEDETVELELPPQDFKIPTNDTPGQGSLVTDPLYSFTNRKMRRRIQQQFGYIPIDRERVHLASTDEVLEHDGDITYYEQELDLLRKVQVFALQMEDLLKNPRLAPILEDSMRMGLVYGKAQESRVILAKRVQRLPQGERIRFAKKTLPLAQRMDIVYKDEEEREFFRSFEGVDLPFRVIFEESNRLRQERIDLMRMQTAWLRGEPWELEGQMRPGRIPVYAPQSPGEIEKVVLEPENEIIKLSQSAVLNEETPQQEAETVEQFETEQEAYPLSDWDLFWTTRMWSRAPNHLVHIDTSSRKNAADELRQVAKGEISVKPESIVRAVEFHLQRDVIQKALAIRNKYGPDYVRDWIKLKRGDDRILLLIPDSNEHKAIFFAAGRDVVYRGI